MRLILWLLPVLIIASNLVARQACATHIVGGDLNIIYNSGDNYRLRLTLYFDLFRGSPDALDSAAQIRIFSKRTNALMGTHIVQYSERTLVTFTNTNCPTGVDSLKTSRIRYEKVISLPASRFSDTLGYYAVWDRCCRNGLLTNIVNSAVEGQLFYLEFPAVTWRGQPFRNSSPIDFHPLSDYGCVGRLFAFDFSGVDHDGDSLVYSLEEPWAGNSTGGRNGAYPTDTLPASPRPYPHIEWKAGYSMNLQIPGTPALGIDGRTGVLTMKPTQIGLFVFAVECREYRKGRYLGTARRDFQILVVDCEKNTVPTLRLQDVEGKPIADGDTVDLGFENGSSCLALTVEDSVADQFYMSLTAPGLEQYSALARMSGETTNGQMTFTTTLCVDPCAGSQGLGIIPGEILVTDNACSLPNYSKLKFYIRVGTWQGAAPRLGNIITPNGDRQNDYMTWIRPLPVNNCSGYFESLEIHNRWGRRVLKTKDPLFAWPATATAAGLYNVSYVFGGKRFTQWVEVVRE